MDSNEFVYQETTTTGWFERLSQSVFGALFGLLIFVVSCGVLFQNEGATNWAKVASGAIALAPSTASTTAQSAGAQGKLVSLSGPVAAPPIGDNLYLKPGPYAVLHRTVEMYAWEEIKDTTRQKHVGGAETKTTTYRYRQTWTDRPENSAQFRQFGHNNPPKALDSQTIVSPKLTIGSYQLDGSSLTTVVNELASCNGNSRRYSEVANGGITMPVNGRISLTPDQLMPSAPVVGDMVFSGRGNPQVPAIGDLRICYSALPVGATATIIGQLQGDRIVPAIQESESFLRVIPGDRVAALAELTSEHKIWRWVWRIVGFVLMWWGLSLIVKPISVVLDVIPLFGDIAEMIGETSSFLVAFVLSATIVLLSSLVHQPIVLLVSGVMVLAAMASLKLMVKLIRN
jgi:hypothetical protein